jgi:hypothetical protein
LFCKTSPTTTRGGEDNTFGTLQELYTSKWRQCTKLRVTELNVIIALLFPSSDPSVLQLPHKEKK